MPDGPLRLSALQLHSHFREMPERTWFTLYFLPIFPIGTKGYYVECQECAGTFKPEVLAYSGLKPTGPA